MSAFPADFIEDVGDLQDALDEMAELERQFQKVPASIPALDPVKIKKALEDLKPIPAP